MNARRTMRTMVETVLAEDHTPRWLIAKGASGRWWAVAPGLGRQAWHRDRDFSTHAEALDYVLSMICKEASA